MPAFDSKFDELCDGVLESDDGCTFDIHKIVLAEKSDYFLGMFCGINKDRSEFRVRGVNGRCLGEILNYIYNGEVCVTEQNLADLMEASDYLLLTDLYSLIKRDFKEHITTANSLRVFNIACHIDDEEITQTSFRIVEIRFEEIRHTQVDVLTQLPLEVLESILGSRSLNVCSKTTVWMSIVEWTRGDISTRVQWVPQLLMSSLARKELDENLAEKILQHEIVSENIFMEGLNEHKDSSDSTSHLDALLHLLRNNNPSCLKRPLFYRCPLRLHVISSYDRPATDAESGPCHLYITYDENFDFWSKVGKGGCFHPSFLTVVGHNVYLFDGKRNLCKKFDLVTRLWVRMPQFRNVYSNFCVVESGGCIYVMGNLEPCLSFRMEGYDTSNGRWFRCSSLRDISRPVAAARDKKIYLVGIRRNNPGHVTAAHVFDTATRAWSTLPSPSRPRVPLALVCYRDKLYLIRKAELMGFFPLRDITNMEVLDPAANYWQILPSLQITHEKIVATVLNDRVYIYDEDGDNSRCVLRWNASAGRLEHSDASPFLRDMRDRRFCTVSDVDAVRRIVKGNRRPSLNLVESLCM